MDMYIDAIYCICILYNRKTEGLKCICIDAIYSICILYNRNTEGLKCICILTLYIVFVYCIIKRQKD